MRMVFITNPWPSSSIRGRQIAERIDYAVVDPDDTYSSDVFIFIKVHPPQSILDFAKKCYLDVVDNVPAAKECPPSSGVIAIGKTAQGYISKILNRDDVILIPEHHCNFDREVRSREEVKRVGYCGLRGAFHLDLKEITDALASIGMEFVYNFHVKSRMCVVDFYKSIDIHLTFRRDARTYEPLLKNPLKLVNAGSFNIPSIGYPEQNYVDEWDGCFAKAYSLDDVVKKVKILKGSSAAYDHLSGVAHEKAKEYHIDKIIPLYKELVV